MLRRTLLASAAAVVAMGGVAQAQDDPMKVGFVYVGSVADGGWTFTHDEGRKAVEEQFGDAVETVFVENVPEGPDAVRVMTQMALEGADLIFTTSFGFMDATVEVASQFPDVRFEHATGYKQAENLSVYSARFYEGRAIQGHIAGHLTESNIVGYIASYPIPEVIRGINSAYIHAKEVNPDVEFKIIWAYTWFDPAKEAESANVLIEQGADVILQHTDSTAPQAAAQAANEAGATIYTFGQANDMIAFAPMPRVSSIIDNWAPYYIDRTQAVMDGTWESVNTWDGMDTGMVKIGEISEVVPAEVKASAEAMMAAITAGEYHPFTGPLNKQDGTPWLAEGEVAELGELAGMNFYVEGLDAELPQ